MIDFTRVFILSGHICLNTNAITGQGLAYLAQMPNLEYLKLGNDLLERLCDPDDEYCLPVNRFSGDALGHLAEAKKLRKLSLYNLRMSDDTFAAVASIKSLYVLEAARNNLTKKCLPVFDGLAHLQCVALSDPFRVSHEVQAYFAKRPDVRVAIGSDCSTWPPSPDWTPMPEDTAASLNLR